MFEVFVKIHPGPFTGWSTKGRALAGVDVIADQDAALTAYLAALAALKATNLSWTVSLTDKSARTVIDHQES